MTAINKNSTIPPKLPTQEKLNLETAIIKWKELQLFFAQGKLLIISNTVDLIEVATVIAENDETKLGKLIEALQVQFATPDWITANVQDSSDLWAVVVSPYVVAQLKIG